jgi:hypothetical protein
MQGYHPGLEDDAFYLAAIKHNLNPSLFPTRRRLFPRAVSGDHIRQADRASSVRLDPRSPGMGNFILAVGRDVSDLVGQCWRISRRCFAEAHAQWAAVTLVAVLLTLPVSGTGLSLTDQYLHPRALATALILAAIVAVLDAQLLLAGALLTAAFFVHAIMAAFGASYCLFLLWKPAKPSRDKQRAIAALAALLLPLGWIFEPASDAWRQAAATRPFYFVLALALVRVAGSGCSSGAAVVVSGAGPTRAARHSSGARGRAAGVFWRISVGGGVAYVAASAVGASAPARADALSASCISVVRFAGGRIAGAVRTQETCAALAAAVCAAERRDVLCAAADVSGDRASGTAATGCATKRRAITGWMRSAGSAVTRP